MDSGGNASDAICVRFRLHRAEAGVLYENEMCGPFLPRRTAQSEGIDRLAWFPVTEWVLLTGAALLLLPIPSTAVMLFMRGKLQRLPCLLAVAGMLGFFLFQLLVF